MTKEQRQALERLYLDIDVFFRAMNHPVSVNYDWQLMVLQKKLLGIQTQIRGALEE